MAATAVIINTDQQNWICPYLPEPLESHDVEVNSHHSWGDVDHVCNFCAFDIRCAADVLSVGGQQ